MPNNLTTPTRKPRRDLLTEVMTTREAEITFGLALDSVRKAAQRGQIRARKSGGTWLILRADAEARWGTASPAAVDDGSG